MSHYFPESRLVGGCLKGSTQHIDAPLQHCCKKPRSPIDSCTKLVGKSASTLSPKPTPFAQLPSFQGVPRISGPAAPSALLARCAFQGMSRFRA